MKMNIIKTSEWDYKDTKVFDSLQELLDFVKEQGECILIPPVDDEEWKLEIYDTWRE